MTDRQLYEVTNLDRYGSAPLPWTRPHDLLHKGALGPEGRVFLGTAGAGGVPHAAGIGVAGLDGDLYLTSGSHTRKSGHFASRPACTISIKLEGIDLVLEGEAARSLNGASLSRWRPSTARASGRLRSKAGH